MTCAIHSFDLTGRCFACGHVDEAMRKVPPRSVQRVRRTARKAAARSRRALQGRYRKAIRGGGKVPRTVVDERDEVEVRSETAAGLEGRPEAANLVGIFATFTCSHHVSAGEFHSSILEAAVDAKKVLRRVCTFTQRSDHPILATIPETEYLRGYAYEVVASW